MTHAICVRCGAMKFGCLVVCGTCGRAPVSGRQTAYAFALSDHYFDRAELEAWSKDTVAGHCTLPLLSTEQEEELIRLYAPERQPTMISEPDVLSTHEPRATAPAG